MVIEYFLAKYRNTLKRIVKWPGPEGYKKKMIYNVSVVFRLKVDKEKKDEIWEMWQKAFEDVDALARENPPISKK